MYFEVLERFCGIFRVVRTVVIEGMFVSYYLIILKLYLMSIVSSFLVDLITKFAQ